MMNKTLFKRLTLLLFAFSGLIIMQGCNLDNTLKTNKKAEETVLENNNESIYQTDGRWDNQYGDTITLSQLTGRIPIVSMVFTRCKFACPRTVADMQAIEKSIPADKKKNVVFVLVSFDSEGDRTQQLKTFTKQMNLNNNWLVLHGNEDDVRQLSMLLDVKYKKQANGDYTHSSGITLLDTKGRIASQIDGLGKDPGVLIEKIKTL